MLKREDFNIERVEKIISEAQAQGPFTAYTHEEREATRREFLKTLPKNSDLWVFGYGSLMWNPAILFEEAQAARLFGFRRNFCLDMKIGRGSPKKPGVMLALDHGGSCNGMAFRIKASAINTETDILWMREMLSGVYLAKWAKMKLNGKTVKGLVFIINRKHSRYVGKMAWSEKVNRLAYATGPLGSNREYLQNTLEHLDQMNVHDQYLHRLWRDVCEK